MAGRGTAIRKRLAAAELIHSVGFDLRRTDRAVEADMQARLATVGLQMGMWFYLRSLWFEDALTQSELSQRVGASKPTTLHQLRRMEQRGLVRLQRSGTDQRVVHVLLTAEGRALKVKLLPLAEQNHSKALYGFSEAEINVLLRALRRIRHNVRDIPFSSNERRTRPVNVAERKKKESRR